MTNKLEPTAVIEASVSRRGGIIFVVLVMSFGAIVSGTVATLMFIFGPTFLVSTLDYVERGVTVETPTFQNADEFLYTALSVAIPIVSLFCLIIGGAFLELNNQTGFARYFSAALTGAVSFCIPTTLLGLLATLGDSVGVIEILITGCFSMIPGAIGAIIFLAIVQKFISKESSTSPDTKNSMPAASKKETP